MEIPWTPSVAESSTFFMDIEALVETALSYAAHERIPLFSTPGRTAYCKRCATAIISDAKIDCGFIKFKGIGLYGFDGQYKPPSVLPYYRLHSHLGFAADGAFVWVESASSPMGGMYLQRALNEFEVMKVLCQRSISLIPICVIALAPRAHGATGDPRLGISVSAVPCGSMDRVDSLVRGTNVSDSNRDDCAWRSTFGLLSHASSGDQTLLSLVMKRFGESIRQFHECGFYRFSGYLRNIAYCSQTDSVLLADVDSSQYINALDPAQRALYKLRDVSSGLFGLICGVLESPENAIYAPDNSFVCDCVQSYLEGYSELSASMFAPAVDLISRLYDVSRQYAEASHFRRRGTEMVGNLNFQESRRLRAFQYWINRKATYSVLMCALANVFNGSVLGDEFAQSEVFMEAMKSGGDDARSILSTACR